MSDAPREICLDPTSEDENGIFTCAAPGDYLNMDVPYIRADIAQADIDAAVQAERSECWLLEHLDTDEKVYLASYAGGAAPGGAWATLSLRRVLPDGTEQIRGYLAVNDWYEVKEAATAAIRERGE